MPEEKPEIDPSLVAMLQNYKPSMARVDLSLDKLFEYIKKKLAVASKVRVKIMDYSISKFWIESDKSVDDVLEMIRQVGKYHCTEFLDGSVALMVEPSKVSYCITIHTA